jgi:DNA-binding XRE family transcriptional regulator
VTSTDRKKFRDARTKGRIRLDEVAKPLKIHTSTLYGWENGRGAIPDDAPPRWRKAIVEALNRRVQDNAEALKLVVVAAGKVVSIT